MRLNWNQLGERFYENGLDRAVLYVDGKDGVAWNGITALTETPSGGEARPYYIDGVKFINLATFEEFGLGLNALYSPVEFDVCDGAINVGSGVLAQQQIRKAFGFSFRTKIGNDLESTDDGYKIHIVYNALASPTQRNYKTEGEDTELSELSWAISTRSIPFSGLRPTAHITVDASKVKSWIIGALEDILYGTATSPARIPLPTEVLNIFEVTEPKFIVTNNGNGTYDLTGPDDAIEMLDEAAFEISYSGAVWIDDISYTLTSST